MKNIDTRKNLLFYSVPIGILISVVLSSFYLYTIKLKLTNDLIGLRFILESESLFDASLLYTYNQKFSSLNSLKSEGVKADTLFFAFPKSDSIIKKFRLDFGKNLESKPVKIKELHLLFNNGENILNEDKVYEKLYNVSPSIKLDKKEKTIYFRKEVIPFDPYIIFAPLVEFTIQKSIYSTFLLIPFGVLLVVFLCFGKWRCQLGILDVILLLFVFCIPLKIAWTTFCTLLLCAYGLFWIISKKEFFYKNQLSFFFLGLFLSLLLLGRPSSIADIDMQFSLLLWAIISATLYLPKINIYKYYTSFIILLNAVMLASGLSFLLWFNEFYGLGISDYFQNVKIYSRDVRGWLYYDHAAFLSFFGIVGVLFMHELYKKKSVHLRSVWLYHILVILFIVITATRIGVIIYLVFLFNIIVKLDLKKRIALNTFIYIVFTFFLVGNIHKTDESRNKLWIVSWDAIKERPFFGYGLGQSNKILHTGYFAEKSIGPPSLDLNHSHNQFLTYLLEIGVIGFLVIFFGFIYFLYRTRLYQNTMLIVFLFGLAFLFLTESALQTSKPLYVLCFLLLLLGTNEKDNDSEKISF